MTLSELLEELKGIDPETADDIGDIVNVISILSDGSFSSDAYYPDFIIQGCLQRACERRRWTLTLEYVSWYAPMRRWHAYISTGPRGCDTKDTAADSAAEALLAAYIAAVKEEKR